MPKVLRARGMHYEIIDRNLAADPWTGAPTVLQPSSGVNMPQTTIGSMVLAWVNQSKMNNAGTLAWTSGGSAPSFLPAPALQAQPFILVQNWRGNNLSVTNVSPANTPLWAAAYGPGIPGSAPQPLKSDGTPVQLSTLAAAQGPTQPRWMQLNLANSSGNLAILVIIGGPVDSAGNNAYVISLNDAANTGPGTGTPPPNGYYATTTGNSYSYQLNWGGAQVFVAAMSPATGLNATVSLTSL